LPLPFQAREAEYKGEEKEDSEGEKNLLNLCRIGVPEKKSEERDRGDSRRAKNVLRDVRQKEGLGKKNQNQNQEKGHHRL